MKPRSKVCARVSMLCVFSVVLAGCQSTPVQDLQNGLRSIDLNLNSSSYVVRAGETLNTIAFRYNTSVEKLVQLNPNAAQGVYAGMYLNIRDQTYQATGTTTNVARANSSSSGLLPSEPLSQQPLSQQQRVVGRTSPTRTNQAIPIAQGANEQMPFDFERRSTSLPIASIEPSWRQGQQAMPRVVGSSSATGYVEQKGFPVEEVIEDENFILPTSQAGVSSVPSGFDDNWHWPMAGQLARDFDPQRPNGRGIEIVGLPGQEVYAARDGVVDLVARSPDGIGKVVIVRHENNYLSVYSNTRDLFVSAQDTVRQGDPIASLGANVNDEPLLRFEISKDGKLLNPMDFLTPL